MVRAVLNNNRNLKGSFMKLAKIFICALSVLVLINRVDASALYGSTSAGGPGELYVLNPTTGAVIQDVGALNDPFGANYPITGLAFNPFTGVLYGSTGNSTAASAAKLVTINPASGLVTVIGSFNAGPVNSSGSPATMADIAFDSAGNLFGIGSIGGPQLYSINVGTGQATAVGSTGLTSTSGGGLAISAAGAFYGSPTPSRFGTYDPGTGAYANIVNPTKPVGGAYAALAFDGSTLYGLDLGPGPALTTHLVTFDTTTGAVTDVTASVAALDAIAFSPIPEPSTTALLASGVISILVGARRRK
jgi:PEP-CTERM motif